METGWNGVLYLTLVVCARVEWRSLSDTLLRARTRVHEQLPGTEQENCLSVTLGGSGQS